MRIIGFTEREVEGIFCRDLGVLFHGKYKLVKRQYRLPRLGGVPQSHWGRVDVFARHVGINGRHMIVEIKAASGQFQDGIEQLRRYSTHPTFRDPMLVLVWPAVKRLEVNGVDDFRDIVLICYGVNDVEELFFWEVDKTPEVLHWELAGVDWTVPMLEKMYYHRRLTYQEIANLMNCSSSSVGVAMSVLRVEHKKRRSSTKKLNQPFITYKVCELKDGTVRKVRVCSGRWREGDVLWDRNKEQLYVKSEALSQKMWTMMFSMINTRGYIRESRLVMSQYLGRPMKSQKCNDDFDEIEEVHHINGDSLDNRLDNLEIVVTRGQTTIPLETVP